MGCRETEEPPTPEKPATPSFSLTANAKDLQAFLTAIATVTDEPTFAVTKTGITVRAMDPSRVCMVEAEYPHTSLEAYVSPEQDGVVAVQLMQLLKILKLAKAKDTAVVVCNPETERLEVTLKGATISDFDMPLLEPAEEVPPEPKIVYTTLVTVPTKDLQDAFKKVELAGDHVAIEAGEAVTMTVKGDFINAEVRLEKGEPIVNLEAKEQTRAVYSLSYLTDIVKDASPLAELVDFEYASEMPCKINFRTNIGRLVYHLAPRVEVE